MPKAANVAHPTRRRRLLDDSVKDMTEEEKRRFYALEEQKLALVVPRPPLSKAERSQQSRERRREVQGVKSQRSRKPKRDAFVMHDFGHIKNTAQSDTQSEPVKVEFDEPNTDLSRLQHDLTRYRYAYVPNQHESTPPSPSESSTQ
ncbi:hypothetical protein VNI00_001045 [Paramarasmius palmivorus]|uniref:Centrosome and spindle pole associated protein 1 n=1 Tax=Paramarasmius palmivorus TaxID=297713 RepID=A0AAW0E7P8_9AGAR